MSDPNSNGSGSENAPRQVARTNVWRRRFYLVVIAWLTTTFLMSFPGFRGIVAYPLYAHDRQASGEAAYVMADGPAYWERLRAASDLYHWERIERIIILHENTSDGYNFVRKKSDSRFERSVAYLGLFGVPENCISSIPVDPSAWFGSLSEARGVAAQFPELKRLVVVTSAPHTRRSRLCFRRSFSKNVDVQIYSATVPAASTEITYPIWIEYVKLAVYLVVA